MASNPKKSPGYDDTPIIPGSEYRVHDSKRPQPRVVVPGTNSTPEQAGQAPSDAVILFGGSDVSQWVGKDGGAVQWKVENGYMEATPKSGDIESKEHFGDCQLHVEWATPSQKKGESQGRGNSGVFLLGTYEIQVLDCYENPTYADGTTGAIYGQFPPLVNACRAPGEWQSFDVVWQSPRFEGEKLTRPAIITVIYNGLLIHHHKELQGPTHHKRLASYAPAPETGPLKLQDHGDPVRYRNIWYRPLTDYDQS